MAFRSGTTIGRSIRGCSRSWSRCESRPRTGVSRMTRPRLSSSVVVATSIFILPDGHAGKVEAEVHHLPAGIAARVSNLRAETGFRHHVEAAPRPRSHGLYGPRPGVAGRGLDGVRGGRGDRDV